FVFGQQFIILASQQGVEEIAEELAYGGRKAVEDDSREEIVVVVLGQLVEVDGTGDQAGKLFAEQAHVVQRRGKAVCSPVAAFQRSQHGGDVIVQQGTK